MSTWLTKRVLSDAHVALRAMPETQARGILRALLLTSDEAIFVTGLDHLSYACNARFGEYFLVEPDEVVRMQPEDLREKVYPRLKDPAGWVRQLEEIYAKPELTYQDELELIAPNEVVLRRTTGPVIDAEGRIIGRLWTFRDITAERKRLRMQEVLFQVSTHHEADPAAANAHVVKRLSRFYQAVAILSILEGEIMDFREIAGLPSHFPDIRENPLKDAY